ncbi:hypothetical protein [Saccharothrix deserti]|uniref:hypothetical protein n=1 Tax=Saccharothrix deserti TaxID=2593674 RepID=UPI00131A7F88|nr:hypothetical protein [Saccharothrix deserti]
MTTVVTDSAFTAFTASDAGRTGDGEVLPVEVGRSTRLGVRVRRGSDGRLDLVPDGTTSGPVRAALLAHGSVAQVVVRRHRGRLVAVVLPRDDEHLARRPATPTELALDRVARLAPRRVLHIGIGGMELPTALSAQCVGYDLVDPSVPKVCEVLAGRPDLRQRLRLLAAPPTVDVFADEEPYDVVLLDMAAPSLSVLDVPTTAVDLLRLVHTAGAVFVANLRDPRLERLANQLRTGRAKSTPDAAGWSPPAVLRAIAQRAPWTEAHAYPLLGPLPEAATYGLLLRPARTVVKVPLLRWGRDLHSTAQLAQLLAGRGVERLRLIGIPPAGVADIPAARRPGSGRPRAAVDWREIDAVAAEHRYRVTPVASLTGAEDRFDVLVERKTEQDGRRPGGGLAARLRAWLAVRLPEHSAAVDLVVLGDDANRTEEASP